MTLKAGFAQVAAPTATGTIDFTDSNAGFASDAKVAIFTGTRNTANHTVAATAEQFLGLATVKGGVTVNQGYCTWATDNIAHPIVGKVTSLDTLAAFISNAGTSSGAGASVVSAWLSNGARLNFTTAANAAYLINGLMLGGDIEANIVRGSFVAGSPSVLTLAHGLSGVPELAIFFNVNHASQAAQSTQLNMMFVDVAHAAMAGRSIGWNTGSNEVSGSISDVGVRRTIGSSALDTFVSADATNIVFNSSTSNAMAAQVLVVRGTTSPLKVAVGTFPTPTSTPPVTASVTGLSFQPQVVLVCPSAFLAAADADNDDTGSRFGLGIAINNLGGIAQGSASLSDDANSSPTVCKNQVSNSEIVRLLQTSNGAADVQGALSAFNSDGFSIAYTNVAGSALYSTYLALAQDAGGALGHKLAGKFGGRFKGRL